MGEEEEEEEEEKGEEEEEEVPGNPRKVVKPLSRKALHAYNEKLEKRGVVYLSRVPPFMKPAKVKHLLGMHGAISKLYLAPEDFSERRKRKKGGGNRGMRWTEGWVEFEDKNIAKAVASSLNNTPIGGKKREYYREDIWNIKYLKGFKWDHLTEKVAYERRMREAKVRMETLQAKREAEVYADMVDKGKGFAEMEKRKKARGVDSAASEGAVRRHFRQAQPVRDVGGHDIDKSILELVGGKKKHGNKKKKLKT